MKLAVSSLAWDPSEDEAVRAVLVRRGVAAIELAPLRYWPSVSVVTAQTLADYRARWADAGISIVALQGILFGMPDLQLFGSSAQQAALEGHLVGMGTLAAALGAEVVVFGAPKNRLRGVLSEEAAIAAAAPLLRRVAGTIHALGVTLCIEPNPARYGGDFVRTIAEGIRLVEVVSHPGLALHLDAGAAAVNGETDEQFVHAARSARHYHISEVDLVPVGSGTVDHRHLGGLLKQSGYGHWLSIEMRSIALGLQASSVERAVDIALTAYK